MEEKKKDVIEIRIPKLGMHGFRKNPWILSTIVLAVLVFMFLASSFNGITGNVISSTQAEEIVMDFLNAQSSVEAEILSIEDNDNGFYEVRLSVNGQLATLYVTRDGKNIVQGVIPVEEIISSGDDGEEIPSEPAKPILECAESYGITSDTIIFYYSNSCGWCTKMKPGVELLEKEGYKFKWIEAGASEDLEIINNCVQDHMTSGGVPQFICPKTDEIHVGAFADANGDLDQVALKEWVDNCINN